METIGKVFARRVKEIRGALHWKQEDLARRLMELEAADDGRTLNTWRVKVARTESGDRKVSVDEAFLFAAALGVHPGALFRPLENVAIARRLELDPVLFDSWARGWLPLRRDDIEIYEREVHADRPVAPSPNRLGPFLEEIAKRGDLRPEVRESGLAYTEHRRRELEQFRTLAQREGLDQAGLWTDAELDEAGQAGVGVENLVAIKDRLEPSRRRVREALDEMQALAEQFEAELPKKRRKKQ